MKLRLSALTLLLLLAPGVHAQQAGVGIQIIPPAGITSSSPLNGANITAATITLASMAPQGSYTLLGNNTGSSASPVANSIIYLGGTPLPGTSAGVVASFSGANSTSYTQVNVQNTATAGQAGYTATSATGTDSTHYAGFYKNNATGPSATNSYWTDAYASSWYDIDGELNIGAGPTLGAGNAVINLYAGQSTIPNAIVKNGLQVGAPTGGDQGVGTVNATGFYKNGGAIVSAPCAAMGTASGNCAQGGVITAGGPTGSATVAPIVTYNAAGQLTTVSSATITPAVGSITGLGTGVATVLGVNANASGGLPVQTTGTAGCSGWTPSDLSGAGLTFTSVCANYTITGNMVCMYGQLTYPATATVNNAGIAGFPAAAFTSANAYVKYAFPVNQSGTLAFPLIGVLLTSASGFSFINQFTNAAVTNVQLSGQTVGFGVCYPHS